MVADLLDSLITASAWEEALDNNTRPETVGLYDLTKYPFLKVTSSGNPLAAC